MKTSIDFHEKLIVIYEYLGLLILHYPATTYGFVVPDNVEHSTLDINQLEAACKIQQILEEFGAKEVAHLLEKTLEEEEQRTRPVPQLNC